MLVQDILPEMVHSEAAAFSVMILPVLAGFGSYYFLAKGTQTFAPSAQQPSKQAKKTSKRKAKGSSVETPQASKMVQIKPVTPATGPNNTVEASVLTSWEAFRETRWPTLRSYAVAFLICYFAALCLLRADLRVHGDGGTSVTSAPGLMTDDRSSVSDLPVPLSAENDLWVDAEVGTTPLGVASAVEARALDFMAVQDTEERVEEGEEEKEVKEEEEEAGGHDMINEPWEVTHELGQQAVVSAGERAKVEMSGLAEEMAQEPSRERMDGAAEEDAEGDGCESQSTESEQQTVVGEEKMENELQEEQYEPPSNGTVPVGQIEEEHEGVYRMGVQEAESLSEDGTRLDELLSEEVVETEGAPEAQPPTPAEHTEPTTAEEMRDYLEGSVGEGQEATGHTVDEDQELISLPERHDGEDEEAGQTPDQVDGVQGELGEDEEMHEQQLEEKTDVEYDGVREEDGDASEADGKYLENVGEAERSKVEIQVDLTSEDEADTVQETGRESEDEVPIEAVVQEAGREPLEDDSVADAGAALLQRPQVVLKPGDSLKVGEPLGSRCFYEGRPECGDAFHLLVTPRGRIELRAGIDMTVKTKPVWSAGLGRFGLERLKRIIKRKQQSYSYELYLTSGGVLELRRDDGKVQWRSSRKPGCTSDEYEAFVRDDGCLVVYHKNELLHYRSSR